MMTRALRRSLQRQEGQALVMACLLMLILSIALLTTVNIGHNVHERIRLQNTADAAAYSTAAMEARAFNFYAFTNRTQVSHYVSAMLWQSLNSFVFFVQAFLTDIYGFLRTIGPCFPTDSRKDKWIIICGVLDVLPYIGAIMKVMDRIFSVLQNMLLIMKDGMDFIDRAIGRVVVPGHRLLNAVMSGAAVAVMMASSSYVMGTSNTIIAANDPNVDSFIPQTLAGLINQCLFNRTHFDETTISPGQVVTGRYRPFQALDPTKVKDRDKVSRAKRVMGAISNATRFPCNANSGICPDTFVTSRKLGDLLPIPNWLQPLEDLLNRFPKWGQTRMLTYERGFADERKKNGNKIREPNDPPDNPMGMMAQGDIIGADDTYYIKMGPSTLGPLRNPFSCPKEPGRGIGADKRDWKECWGDPRQEPMDMLKPSVWSMSPGDRSPNRNGVHWRVIYRNSNGASRADTNVGLYKSEVCVVPVLCVPKVEVYSANIRIDERDRNHPWAGLAPFPHFEPGDYARDCAGLNPGNSSGSGSSGSSGSCTSCNNGQAKKGEASINQAARREHDFNQPSAWVLLNKDAEQLHNTKADPTGATHNDVSRLNGSSSLTFNFGGSATLELDNDRKKLEVAGFTVASGMSVISRGQTYYHRPGNWTEHPNFFNPYWRPRLASVWQGKESLPLVNRLANALPAAVRDAPAKIITH